ncbi:MAG: hypothetical protein J6A01_10095 [Proteobacteria bacterium]|nr:hypothetical protein [Pseudomonadota bacterium]
MKKLHLTSLCCCLAALAIAGCANESNSWQEDKCETDCSTLDHVASSACQNNACVIVTCESGYSNCDNDSSNGCEKLGVCPGGYSGESCSQDCSALPNVASGSCNNGSCIIQGCMPGYSNCDALWNNGCEKEGECNPTPSDPNVCTPECSSLPHVGETSCNNNSCTIQSCQTGYNNCDADPSNGCEVEGSCSGPDTVCKMTFKYTNADTCLATCADMDYNTFLIGSMNEWKEADPQMAMAAGANCERSITIDVEEGKEYQYKFFVDGWQESYRADDNAPKDADGNNNVVTGECGKTVTFVEKAADPNASCNDPGPGPQPQKCTVTFTYVNADTCDTTGGDANYDVFLVGSMNEWQPADGNYMMSANEKCERSITIEIEEGTKIEYKYFVSGWGGDSFRVDKKATLSASGNMITDGACGANYKYVEKEAKPGDIIKPEDPVVVDNGDCEVTFTYYNQWTNVTSGGAADFDVYVVGSFNTEADGTTWKVADPAWKMVSDGNGTHVKTVKLKKGSEYDYKYYVNGWADDSWKTDAEDGQSNGHFKLDKCGMEIGHGNPNPIEPVDPHPENPDPEVPTVDDCYATFIYVNRWTNVASGGQKDFDVYLIGEMNEWKEADANLKMTSDSNGTHTIKINLEKNKQYKYKYYVNGWEQDSYRANLSTCADDDCNSIIDTATCDQIIKFVDAPLGNDPVDPPTPHVEGTLTLKTQPTVSNKKVTIKVELSGDVTVDSVTRDGKAITGIAEDTITDTVTANGKYVYIIKGSDGSELYVPVWVEDKAFDWHDAVLYFAFTDRFVNGDKANDGKSNTSNPESDWYGGDFKGMTKKVEEGYFDKLGVNTLWISSVSMNTQKVSWGTGNDSQHSYSAYHSYWPISSFMTEENKSEFGDIKAIEPHFGTEAELKALVDACHKRGIRVLVDFAANHVHTDSPIYNNSKYDAWFNDKGHHRLCDDNNNWDNYSEKCWFSKDLPDINYDNADARKAMVDHAIWLIKTTNIDGFRVDAVKHMNIQFIKDLRAATDKLFANTGIMFYMVGETFTGDVGLLNKYIGNEVLHAQFDFPMYYALQSHVLGLGNYAAVAQLSNHYNSDLMGTFMGNHDVARAISVAAGQNQNKWGHNDPIPDDHWLPYLKVKTAWTILLTNPGVPLIYYGDEYGMEGSNDPDNRRMMEFGDELSSEQKGTLDYVRLLGNIRKTHPAITQGHRENLSYGGGYWCYKLVKEGSPSVIVGVSRADGGDNSGCSLNGSYKLKNLLNTEAAEFTATGLDLSNDHLQVYEVK